MLIFIDIETTGTRATRDRITEISALKVVDENVIDQWSSLIQPDCHVPATITQLTGIDDALLDGAPRFAEIAQALFDWLRDGELVAHNARFDYSFLRNEFKRVNLDYRAKVLCTLRLSRALSPASSEHNLAALLRRYDMSHQSLHRADHDVQALWSLWNIWQSDYHDHQWEQLLNTQRRQRSLPVNLDSELIEKIPKCPGVYLFYGHNQLPLYVGKSVDLRSRVMHHFQSDHQDDREMRLAQQIQHIEWEETAGDLGAQLREAELIKTLMPIMNRRLRKQRRLYTWYWPQGSSHPKLIHGESMQFANNDALFGLFRSTRDAKNVLLTLADEHQLCPQVLTLERGRGRCFANQLGKCRGACCQQETLTEHTRRAKSALSKQQFNHWPWRNRIALYEQHAKSRQPAYHLVSQWRYLGSVNTLQEAASFSTDTVPFDRDIYQILTRFLRDPSHHGISVVELDSPSELD